MGCFLDCFSSTKNQNRRKRRANRVQPRAQRHGSYEPLKSEESLKQEILEKPIDPVLESRDKNEEELSFSTKKKVTFDLNVKAYEEVIDQETSNSLSQSEDEEEENGEKEDQNSSSSSLGSFPSNHRYRNCSDSDVDEYEEMESDESDLNDEDESDYEDYDYEDQYHYEDNDVSNLGQGEFSATSMDDSLEQEKRKLGCDRNARDRSQYVHSVLNPVENLTQWKTVKAKASLPNLPLKEKKENINLELELSIPFSPEPTFKQSIFSSNPKTDQSFSFNTKIDQSFSFDSNFDQYSSPSKQEVAVDASLSTWLGSCDTIETSSTEVNKPSRSYSRKTQVDRPTLGALTLEELNQFSPKSSGSRRSPTHYHNPDEMPILGTVGTYWSHSNQTTGSCSSSSIRGSPNRTSKYREDKKVNWDSTPFETRLERALNNEAYATY